MTLTSSLSLRTWVVAAGVLLGTSAHAGLFEDDEARRAILDVRQRL